MSINVGVHTLWPSVVLEIDYGMRLHRQIDETFSKVEFEPTPPEWGRTHKVSKRQTQYWSDDVISQFGLSDFEKELDSVVRQYASMNNMKYTTYKRTSWFTAYDNGDYAHIHNHQSASISGCFYYKTTGEDGNIFFTSPISEMRCSPAWTNMGNRHLFQVKEGKMLIFPGWLNHGVMTNETDTRRISLAFNIEFNYFDEDESIKQDSDGE